MFKEKRRLSVKLNENITDCKKSTVTIRGSSVIFSQNPEFCRTQLWNSLVRTELISEALS